MLARTPSLNIVREAVFYLIHFPALFIRFGHRAILILGIEIWQGAVPGTKPILTTALSI